jgi:hypothetical protein
VVFRVITAIASTAVAFHRGTRVTYARLIIAALSALPAPTGAQVVRGLVVGPDATPVGGVVVSLMDSTSNPVGRALTDDRGEFRLRALRAGTYRIGTLRIGFQPGSSPPLVLALGAEVWQRVVLASIPVALQAVRVTGASSCRIARESAASTLAVWEQARAALAAADLSVVERPFTATTVAYQRRLDPTGRTVVAQSVDIETGVVTQPWRSIAPDDARRRGYVITHRDGSTTYHAPGLDVLLSPAFTEDHCLYLTRGQSAGRLGLAFEPVPERRSRRAVAALRGTMWIDEQSAELRSLEFRYVNVSSAQADHAGGELSFVRMRDGAWAIARWSLRMPMLEFRAGSQRYGVPDTIVAEMRVKGGELALATRGTDTLWAQPPLVVAGSVRDAGSGTRVGSARVSLLGTTVSSTTDGRGRFHLTGLIAGRYTLEVRTPSLDSLGVAFPIQRTITESLDDLELRVPTGPQVLASACGTTRLDSPGVVLGTVTMRADSMPRRGVKVLAEWTDIGLRSAAGAPVVDRQTKWLEATPDSLGTFRLCGVPVDTPLSIRAEYAGAGGAPAEIRIKPSERFTRATVVLDRIASRAATFAGVVVAESTNRPIPQVEISLPDLAKGVVSNDGGEFQLTDVAPGTHRIHVRRLGYGPLDTVVAFRPNQKVDRVIVLRNVVALDSVRVTAEAISLPPSFEEHRKTGLGTFVTREEFAQRADLNLADVLSELPSTKLYRGVGRVATVGSGRAPPSLQRDPAVIDPLPGIHAKCVAKVFVDGTLMNPGSTAEPFDVNTIAPQRIEAMEWYAGAAQIPPLYSRLNTTCGVLVIWLRR